MNIFWKCSIQLVSWTQRYSAWRPTTYPVPALSALLATYTSVVWYTASE